MKRRTERGKKSSRTAELRGFGEGAVSAQETEQDGQRHEDMPRVGARGASPREQGQSQGGVTTQSCHCPQNGLDQRVLRLYLES